MANLDRETQDRYEVVVRATDMAGQLGGLSGSTTVTIVITDVNDNPPRFPQSKAPAWRERQGGCPQQSWALGGREWVAAAQDPEGHSSWPPSPMHSSRGGSWRMVAGGVTAGPDCLLRRGKTGESPPPLSPSEFSSSVLLPPCSPPARDVPV